MICPTCSGEKTIQALVNRGAAGCRMETIACYRCKGTGQVPEQDGEWQRVGAYLRADRLLRDMSQREEARELGLDVTLIGKMESGIIDPAPYYVAWEKRRAGRMTAI